MDGRDRFDNLIGSLSLPISKKLNEKLFKKNNLIQILNENIKLLAEIDKDIKIQLSNNNKEIYFNSDKEQISRVFFNLIKNAIESIQQKNEKNPNFDKKILIEISDNNDHIKLNITDNGIGFKNLKNDINEILNPYFTTKKNGTGLGLSIVNKIINDHEGKLLFFPISNGAKVEITFRINVSRNFNSWW